MKLSDGRRFLPLSLQIYSLLIILLLPLSDRVRVLRFQFLGRFLLRRRPKGRGNCEISRWRERGAGAEAIVPVLVAGRHRASGKATTIIATVNARLLATTNPLILLVCSSVISLSMLGLPPSLSILHSGIREISVRKDHWLVEMIGFSTDRYFFFKQLCRAWPVFFVEQTVYTCLSKRHLTLLIGTIYQLFPRFVFRPNDLRDSFERFGPLKDIYLPRNYYTGYVWSFVSCNQMLIVSYFLDDLKLYWLILWTVCSSVWLMDLMYMDSENWHHKCSCS